MKASKWAKKEGDRELTIHREDEQAVALSNSSIMDCVHGFLKFFKIWALRVSGARNRKRVSKKSLFVRKAPDTFKFLSHVMRAIWPAQPKCSHRCVSLKETSLKPVQSLKHTTFYSAEQTAMRMKWFKHIAIEAVQEHLLFWGLPKNARKCEKCPKNLRESICRSDSRKLSQGFPNWTPFFQRRRNDDKNNFWEVESKRGSAEGSERGSTGDPSWNFIVGLKHRKNSILESRIFIVVAFPRKYSDNNFGQLPPFHPPGGRTRVP